MNVLIDGNYQRSDHMQDVIAHHGHRCVIINHIDASNVCLMLNADVIFLDELCVFSFFSHYDALLNGRYIHTIVVLSDGVVPHEVMDALRFRFISSAVRIIDRSALHELLAVLDDAPGRVVLDYGADSAPSSPGGNPLRHDQARLGRS